MAKKAKRVLNYFCESGSHEKCMGRSQGDKNDRVNFECTCSCHEWNKK